MKLCGGCEDLVAQLACELRTTNTPCSQVSALASQLCETVSHHAGGPRAVHCIIRGMPPHALPGRSMHQPTCAAALAPEQQRRLSKPACAPLWRPSLRRWGRKNFRGLRQSRFLVRQTGRVILCRGDRSGQREGAREDPHHSVPSPPRRCLPLSDRWAEMLELEQRRQPSAHRQFFRGDGCRRRQRREFIHCIKSVDRHTTWPSTAPCARHSLEPCRGRCWRCPKTGSTAAPHKAGQGATSGLAHDAVLGEAVRISRNNQNRALMCLPIQVRVLGEPRNAWVSLGVSAGDLERCRVAIAIVA